MKLCFIRLSALGDIIHALPALMTVKTQFPDAHVDWVVEDRFVGILEQVKEIDNLIVMPRRNRSTGRYLKFLSELRRREYDFTIDFQGLFKSGIVAFFSRATTKIGFAAPQSRELSSLFYTRKVPTPSVRCNVMELNLKLLEPVIGKVRKLEFPRIFSSDDLDGVLDKLHLKDSNKLAIINPLGAWETKRWNNLRYAEIADWLTTEYQCKVVLSCYGEERTTGQEIIDHMQDRDAAILSGDLSFRELAALCSRSFVCIGPDTGPTHIAASQGCPTVMLFGPSDAWRNGPLIETGIAISSDADCIGCWQRECLNLKCMHQITTKMVRDGVKSALALSAD